MPDMNELDTIISRLLWSEIKDPSEFRSYLARAGYKIVPLTPTPAMCEAGVPWEMVERWWQEHQEQDSRRRAMEAATREARRRIVLSKLSAEERELLGIKE